MDRPRRGEPFPKRRQLAVFTFVIVLIGVAVVVDFQWLRPSMRLNKGDYVLATVQRGMLPITVQGTGRLRPIAERWVTVAASGTVELVFAQPGHSVELGDELVILSNPHIGKAAEKAALTLAEAQAQHQGLLADFADRRLTGEARLVDYQAAYDEIQLRLEAETKLLAKSTISGVDHQQTRIKADRARTNLDIERRRLRELENALVAGRKASEAKLAVRKIELQLAQDEVDALTVRTPVQGVVRTVLVEPGQQLSTGAKIARIADISALMGEIRIPESYAQHVAATQSALASVLNVEMPAVVTRVDPAVTGGSVAVNMKFAGLLPAGARPDLSIRATITVAELEDVLYVRRPPHVNDNGAAEVFKLVDNRTAAVRARVRFGLGTLREIQVIDGLNQGDVLVLGDTRDLTGDRLDFQ